MANLAAPFKDLPDIDDVRPMGPMDRQCLEDIRNVLLKYNMIDRFGVTLLHAHFPVYEGEVLVETCDHNSRALEMHPVAARQDLADQAVETSWRLTATGDIFAAAKCTSACVREGGKHKKKHVKMAPLG